MCYYELKYFNHIKHNDMDLFSITGVLGFAHEDDRRIIHEINFADSAVQEFTLKKEAILGNHYHKEKSETFVVTKGKGIVVLCPLDTDGNKIGEPTQANIHENMVINIPKYMAHTFKLEEGTVMLCYSSAPYDNNNKDLIPFTLDI